MYCTRECHPISPFSVLGRNCGLPVPICLSSQHIALQPHISPFSWPKRVRDLDPKMSFSLFFAQDKEKERGNWSLKRLPFLHGWPNTVMKELFRIKKTYVNLYQWLSGSDRDWDRILFWRIEDRIGKFWKVSGSDNFFVEICSRLRSSKYQN